MMVVMVMKLLRGLLPLGQLHHLMRAEASHDEHLFVIVTVLVRFQTTWGGGVLVGGRVGVGREEGGRGGECKC